MVVVLCMLPGLPGLLETLEHLVHDGHLPHSAQHEQVAHAEAPHQDEEHGCTSLAHRCGCHASMPAVLPDDDAPEDCAVAPALGVQVAARARQRQHRATAPPWRPPIG